jgi:hypothetical protein
VAERSAYEAAVEAMAGALDCSGGCDWCYHARRAIPRALAALVASAEVREADVPCLVHPGQEKCGGAIRGANVRLHPACFLAALSPGETNHPSEKGTP